MDRSAETIQALADPTRLRLLHLLMQTGEICVCELVDALQIPQYNVSRHLHVLANAGWVEDRRLGKWIYYRIAKHLKPYQRTLLAALEKLRVERQDFRQDEARAGRRLKLRRGGFCCVGLVSRIGQAMARSRNAEGRSARAPLKPAGSSLQKREDAMESSDLESKTIKQAVEERYAAIARGEIKSCCNNSDASSDVLYNIATMAQGYKSAELAALPEGANLGLGCGDPTADADLQPGQTVLDLGSGAGVDCFLAARRVGPSGHVIGVDMTDAMLEKARANARHGGFTNVEFRKGEIEKLPVDSGTVDRIISNCVINLAPDKRPVFAEAYRVLKAGGIISISDIVSFGPVPESVRKNAELWAGCIAGTLDKQDYLALIREAGFKQVSVVKEVAYDYIKGPDYGFASVTVWAVK